MSNDHDEAGMWFLKVSFDYVRAAEPLTLIDLDEARARIEQQLAFASRRT
ncbi:hypothetical protein [Methylobacterium durans]|nr:hypothetical protein [Methylobacterium durans]